MITIFSIPKAFIGNTATLQKNAIRSWKAIPGSEVILYGNDEGVKEAAEEFGCVHIPNVSLSEYNTPYLDCVFYHAQNHATNNILCYTNSDISIPSQILDAVKLTKGNQFLMTGKRLDADTSTYQKMYPGMDWFAFRKGTITDIPHFIVGRSGWDNWMIYHFRSRRIPVIDATGYVVVIHPNHDYNHVPQSNGNGWRKCPESDYNKTQMKNRIIYMWELDDATRWFRGGQLVEKPLSVRDLTQGLILKTPEWLHGVIEPLYRCGHIARYIYLKATVGE